MTDTQPSPLTDEQVAAYLRKKGLHCPLCDSPVRVLDNVEADADLGLATAQCTKCKAVLLETWKLVDVELAEQPDACEGVEVAELTDADKEPDALNPAHGSQVYCPNCDALVSTDDVESTYCGSMCPNCFHSHECEVCQKDFSERGLI